MAAKFNVSNSRSFSGPIFTRWRASVFFFFFSSRRRHTRCSRDWSSDVCSSDLVFLATVGVARTITQCPKDYKIFSQGDPAESVFYIQQGRVKLKVKSKQGKEEIGRASCRERV